MQRRKAAQLAGRTTRREREASVIGSAIYMTFRAEKLGVRAAFASNLVLKEENVVC